MLRVDFLRNICYNYIEGIKIRKLVILLAHIVTCQFCKKRFDRDSVSYVQVSNLRYAHATCYLEKCKKEKVEPILEIFDIENTVQCFYCKKTIRKDDSECHQLYQDVYAHIKCINIENQRPKTEAELLDIFLCKKFNTDFINPALRKQINTFIKEYHYTYSGIEKALTYYYDIQGHEFDKTNYSLGMVPYVYQKAYNYYYDRWLISQKNSNIDINKYIPKEVEVVVPMPTSQSKLKKHFQFIDKDEIIDGE